LRSKLKTIVVLLVIFVLITLAFSKSYTSLIREHKQLHLYINPTYYVYAIGKYINSKFETARADRFSLNGYQRITNPLLANENVISLSQMYSCGTDTAYSLPCMFSNLGRSDYTHAQGKNMNNVLDILSRAGVEILWRDNNSSSKGVADRITYQNFKSKRVNTICDIECRDEGMLVNLQSYVDVQNDKDILIVLHIMGSHGPAYYKRYPDKFKVFTPICKTNQLNECSNEQINNAYDNTIVYTDYFLSKTINFLKSNQSQFKTAMFYMSDHGESLGEHGLYLHGMPYFIAPKEQIHVGSILWFSDEFSKDIEIELLNKKANTKLSHDGVFHTLLGLMNVETHIYKKKLDYIRYVK
jgi:lipid A ethanolaminephosphotransferase